MRCRSCWPGVVVATIRTATLGAGRALNVCVTDWLTWARFVGDTCTASSSVKALHG